jgi:S1/P1 Nuclease
MPEKYAGGSTIAVAKTFASTITTAIKTGKYESDKAGWLTGIDITDPVATAMVWASDANSFVCSTVMPNGVSAVESVDLGGAYYTAAIPIVEEQIAKAGYRYGSSFPAALEITGCGKKRMSTLTETGLRHG